MDEVDQLVVLVGRRGEISCYEGRTRDPFVVEKEDAEGSFEEDDRNRSILLHAILIF